MSFNRNLKNQLTSRHKASFLTHIRFTQTCAVIDSQQTLHHLFNLSISQDLFYYILVHVHIMPRDQKIMRG